MCAHKHRLTEKDKNFLRANRIKPHDCHICEKIADVAKKRADKPKLRVEDEDGA